MTFQYPNIKGILTVSAILPVWTIRSHLSPSLIFYSLLYDFGIARSQRYSQRKVQTGRTADWRCSGTLLFFFFFIFGCPHMISLSFSITHTHAFCAVIPLTSFLQDNGRRVTLLQCVKRTARPLYVHAISYVLLKCVLLALESGSWKNWVIKVTRLRFMCVCGRSLT